MRLSLPLESPFLDKGDDIDELDLDTLVIDDETAERRRESIHQNVISRRHRCLYHIILVWLKELDPTLYPPRVHPISTRTDINLSTLPLLRRFIEGASHDKTFIFKDPSDEDPSTGCIPYQDVTVPPLSTQESKRTPLALVVLRSSTYYQINAATIVYETRRTFLRARPVPQWVTEYFELDTSLSTVSPSPPLSPPTAPSPEPLNPASPYPSPPLSPAFHTPPSSPPASPIRGTPMAATVPTFSGGMKENGWDWLKEIKAHFADARMSTDAARCEYFELKLRADAA
ncbi:hypothetical protein M422DRAFT_241925 [Sphaerobolus stellatus SS14]|nr:hypothetical protein M422DRAFT_241925 [Sphaerobolus stellatus SS14]